MQIRQDSLHFLGGKMVQMRFCHSVRHQERYDRNRKVLVPRQSDSRLPGVDVGSWQPGEWRKITTVHCACKWTMRKNDAIVFNILHIFWLAIHHVRPTVFFQSLTKVKVSFVNGPVLFGKVLGLKQGCLGQFVPMRLFVFFVLFFRPKSWHKLGHWGLVGHDFFLLILLWVTHCPSQWQYGGGAPPCSSNSISELNKERHFFNQTGRGLTVKLVRSKKTIIYYFFVKWYQPMVK